MKKKLKQIFKLLFKKNNRTRTITQKVQTDFGSMYIHIRYDDDGEPCGAWISNPGKEPNSQISGLVKDLSEGLHKALRGF